MADDKKVWRKEDFLNAWSKNTTGSTAKGSWGKFYEAMNAAAKKSTGNGVTEAILCARIARTRTLLGKEGIKCPDTPARPQTMKQTTIGVAKAIGFGTKMSAKEREKFNYYSQ
jgi:hypothetical protein